jgi:hypothetical protein
MKMAALLALSLASFSPSSCSETECTIVTDGSRRVYEHELAHCNGWSHEAFQPADPPRSYVHDYPGRLVVIPCGRRGKVRMQDDAVVVKGCKSVHDRCVALWEEHDVDVSDHVGSYAWKHFDGCAISDS